jgi:hypothetical protein
MSEMKPGNVRVSKGGKALVVAVGIWADREIGHLRIDVTGFGGHTTTSNNPAFERYHRTLFRNMRGILIDQGIWEFGEEGAETEERS